MDVCRRHGISEQTLYRWKARYGELEINGLRRLRQLEDENSRLKRSSPISPSITRPSRSCSGKDLGPAAQRDAVRAMQAHYGFSERRACAVVALARSTCRYRPHRDPATALRERLRTLAEQRRRFGYRRLAVLLCREGLVINVKRVYRLYREEGFAVRRRRRKRLPRTPAMRRPPATRINQRWTMDFIEDRLVTVRRFRTFNVMDAFSPGGLAPWPHKYLFEPAELEALLKAQHVTDIRLSGPGALSRLLRRSP